VGADEVRCFAEVPGPDDAEAQGAEYEDDSQDSRGQFEGEEPRQNFAGVSETDDKA
jgi:hypothetical protein